MPEDLLEGNSEILFIETLQYPYHYSTSRRISLQKQLEMAVSLMQLTLLGKSCSSGPAPLFV